MPTPAFDARPSVIVAGLGNVFLGDDAFGVEVAHRLAGHPLPQHVRLVDTGIRSTHLAFELAGGGCETLILVDVVRRGGRPGTVYVLEAEDLGSTAGPVEAHAIGPQDVAALVRRLGGRVPRIVIVGCEPERFAPASNLSAPVAAAVDEAARVVRELCA